jgi:hypothetical protein
VLGQAYWRRRVVDMAHCPELTPTQHVSVQRMLECVIARSCRTQRSIIRGLVSRPGILTWKRRGR